MNIHAISIGKYAPIANRTVAPAPSHEKHFNANILIVLRSAMIPNAGEIAATNSAEAIVAKAHAVSAVSEKESVKFGIKTDKSNPVINWKGVDENNSVVDTGVITTTGMEGVNQNPQINSNNSIRDTDGEIFSDSTFKIIPDKLNPGSTIRIVGEKFGALQVFDFYINAKKIGSFDTDNQGNFITTMKIPKNEIQDRVDFKIKNNQGEEKILSLRIGNNENRYNESTNSKITLEGIANIIHRGDQLQITGTGSPSTSLILEIKDCVNFLYLFKLSIIF